MAESPDVLLARAAVTPFARDPVAALAAAGGPEQLLAALERALEQPNARAATALALAIGAARAKIPAPLVLRLVPDVDGIDVVPPIVAAIEGDRLAALLDLAWSGRLSWEREALVLFLAARLLDGAEPPRRLTARLRTLLREPLSTQAMMMAGMAAVVLKDPQVSAVAGRNMAIGLLGGAKGLDEAVWRSFTAPVLETLPEEAEARIVSGYTVVRPEPKVGRNDPCPCGSGRKYKKCCAGKEPATLAPPPSLLEQFRAVGARAPRAQQQLFDLLRPHDLERLDPGQLTTVQLIGGARKLASHDRWEAAECFLDVLASRHDLYEGDEPANHRVDLAQMALEVGKVDVAERQMALANPDEREMMIFRARLALAREDPDALEQLERALREGHADDPGILIECAYALLRHSPALGILAARGAISLDRMLDSDELLHGIARARDILGLPVEEPWEKIFDLLLDARSADLVEEASQIGDLRAELRAASARAHGLERELARRESELERVSGEREALVAEVQAQRSRDDRRRVTELEQERQRLRSKIVELKGRVAEGAEQRAELRRELARTTDERSRRTIVTVAEESRLEPEVDEAEGEAVQSRPRRILVPQFSTAASRSVAAVPARIAVDALHEAARLAGGDDPSWSGAKHMRRAPDVLSVRVGRTWRLLFRIADDRLEVIDLVHRRELDNTIARLTR